MAAALARFGGLLLLVVGAGGCSAAHSVEDRPVFVDVFAGEDRTCGLTRERRAVCWGGVAGTAGYFGRGCEYVDGDFECWHFGGAGEELPAVAVEDPLDVALTDVSLTSWDACGLDDDGALHCWSGGVSDARLERLNASRYRDLALGGQVFYLIDSDHRASELRNGHNPHLPSTPPPDGRYDKVAAGYWYGCGLTLGGAIECWGWAPFVGLNEHPMPSPEGEFVDVVAQGRGGPACGLRPDGSAECWAGEELPPRFAPDTCEGEYCELLGSRAGPFTQLAVGVLHVCGLRTDGEVECWGVGSRDGECAKDDSIAYREGQATDWRYALDCGQAMPPAGPFERVAAGAFHTCGLRPDGEIVCWGAGQRRGECPFQDSVDSGQCGQSLPP